MTLRRLAPLSVPSGPAVLALLPQLRAALSGHGPALLPYPSGGAPAGELRPDEPLTWEEDDPDDPTVVVLATSGSTGRPKGALLSASALLASVSATHDRLGGPGRWLLALPAEHVAGLQVLLRSLVSGSTPVVLDLAGGFDPARFAAAAAEVPGARRYTALVPTQVRRLLDAGPQARAALAGFDAVLVGGAATSAGLAAEAADAGARLVITYGMSETCGGCVYDGVPLDGVRVGLDPDDRIRLAGPVLARGYRGRPNGFDTDPDGTRWLPTDDVGLLSPDGVLTVLGRRDDMIVTGGLKVSPGVVESALLELPEVAEAVVVGVSDAQWGQRVVAAVVLAPGCERLALDDVRRRVAPTAGGHAAPRQLLVLPSLPLRGPGKPDRTRLRRLAADPTTNGSGGNGPGGNGSA